MIKYIFGAIIILFIISAIIAIIWTLIENKKKRENQQDQQENQNEQISTERLNFEQFFPYQRKYLLTKNEYYFFTKLIPIANNYNLQILTKIRLADLVETKKNLSYADSNAYFNKIRSKHIDFALVDNMKVVALIELDDSSHKYQSRIERDRFVDDVLQRCGYIIIHTYGNTNQIEQEASRYRNTSNQTQ